MAKLYLDKNVVKLHERPTKNIVRHIYCADEQTIQPGQQSNIPIQMTWNSLKEPPTDWLLGPYSLRNGVVVAWTILNKVNSIRR